MPTLIINQHWTTYTNLKELTGFCAWKLSSVQFLLSAGFYQKIAQRQHFELNPLYTHLELGSPSPELFPSLYYCMFPSVPMYVRNSFLPYLSLLNISLILRNLTYCIVPLIPYLLTSFRTYQLCLTLLNNLFPYLPFMIYLTYQPLPNLSSVPYLTY